MTAIETRFRATQDVLARIKRATEALSSISSPSGLGTNGQFINPRMKLASLKAARENIDHAIATIERKWPA